MPQQKLHPLFRLRWLYNQPQCLTNQSKWRTVYL
jgi:hypothetical protein